MKSPTPTSRRGGPSASTMGTSLPEEEVQSLTSRRSRSRQAKRSKYAVSEFQAIGCSSVPTAGLRALHIMPSPA